MQGNVIKYALAFCLVPAVRCQETLFPTRRDRSCRLLWARAPVCHLPVPPVPAGAAWGSGRLAPQRSLRAGPVPLAPGSLAPRIGKLPGPCL